MNDNGWSKHFIEQDWPNEKRVKLSVVFTWDLPAAYQRAVWYNQLGYIVISGGPAVELMPEYMAGVSAIGAKWDAALEKHNPMATFTSRGCIRRCSFCAVWRTEGKLRELDNWPVRPIICDNNLLACSQKHFDSVIDKLKPLPWTDFNQGLDARLLTKHHAERIAELQRPMVRLAFDHTRNEPEFLSAVQLLRDAGIPKSLIRVYVLVGYQDTPEDALYRLRLVRELGLSPNPMRYNPLDALVRDSYVGPHWTASEVRRYVRYWANLRWFGGIPFEEFRG